MAEKKNYSGKYLAKPVREEGWLWKGLLALVLVAVSVWASIPLLETVLYHNSDPGKREQENAVDYAVMDRYDMSMTNTVANALDGILSIKKVYWLSDDDQVAPEPNQDNYGKTNDPSTLQWLLDDAETLLDGQTMYFNTSTKIIPGTEVNYYLDETILAITWKQEIGGKCYNISEVKISHPSQLRRFLAGGEYGSAIQLTTSEMAASVNAVVASSGDFYKHRKSGVIVYDGVVQRISGKNFDSLFIDEDSNFHFVYAGEITTRAAAEKFAAENNIRFSFGFGPVLIDNGQIVDINPNYALGEVNDFYARAGIGQIDELHYVLVTVSNEFFGNSAKIREFANGVYQLGCQKFYTLDGGQTAVLVMNDKVINKVVYGSERRISDIVYFATAVPEGG